MFCKFGVLAWMILLQAWFSIHAQAPFRVMFYNVENLFDTVDDPLKNDDDFLPHGLMQWTPWKYWEKQKNITRGKLITAAAVSAETEHKMKQMVECKTQGLVEFNTEVDPSLIGGFILEYDTYRMDASVKSKLNTILAALKK